jgi:LAGLIDADG DNA endonuclease family
MSNCEGSELVIWESNLSSNVGYPMFSKFVGSMIQLPLFVKGVVVGLIIGWLTFASIRSNNARLGFSQSLIHFPYLWSVFNILSHYCKSIPRLRIRNLFGKIVFNLWFLLGRFLVLLNFINYSILRGLKLFPL